MIYIVEIPSQRKPSAWRAVDAADFCRVVRESQIRSGENIYDSGTLRQLAAERHGCDLNDEESMAESGLGGLAEKFGLDTMLYRGYAQSEWATTDPGMFDQHAEANGHDLHTQHIFMSAEEGISALNDGTISGHGAWAAIDQLRERLTKDGALEEPIDPEAYGEQV